MDFDLMIYNGTVITMNPAFEIVDNGYVGVKGGAIAAVGSMAEKAPLPTAREPIDAENGLIIERDTTAIRRAVTALRDQRDFRIAMGRRARVTIEQAWTWDMQAPAYIDFFEHGLTQ